MRPVAITAPSRRGVSVRAAFEVKPSPSIVLSSVSEPSRDESLRDSWLQFQVSGRTLQSGGMRNFCEDVSAEVSGEIRRTLAGARERVWGMKVWGLHFGIRR